MINLFFLQEDFNTPKRSRCGNTQDQNEIPSPKETVKTIHKLLTEEKDLTKIKQEKEDSLRELNLLKMYRNKVSKELRNSHRQNAYKEIKEIHQV